MAKRDSFLLRINPALLDAVRRWADDEFRSTNSQIEMILQKALRDVRRWPTTELESEESPDQPVDDEKTG